MRNDLKIECLNAAGLTKPDKAAFMETIADVLETQITCYPYVSKLIGQVLRYYQHWPPKQTQRSNLEWTAQAYDPNIKNETLRYLYRDNAYLIASDGHRVHKSEYAGEVYNVTVREVSNTRVPDFDSFFPPLDGPRTIRLSDFRNVETDLVAWNGFTYEERYILEAFSGSDEMVTSTVATERLQLRSLGGERMACIAPLRR